MSTAAGQVEGDLPLRGHELELLALCSALVCIQASLSCWQSPSIPCVHLMMLCPAGGCWPLASGAVPGQGCLMQPLCLPILTLQVAQPPLCRPVSPSPTSPATAIKVSGTVSVCGLCQFHHESVESPSLLLLGACPARDLCSRALSSAGASHALHLLDLPCPLRRAACVWGQARPWCFPQGRRHCTGVGLLVPNQEQCCGPMLARL